MTNKQIDKICKDYSIDYYTINLDGSIDVKECVYLFGRGLKTLLLKFNKVKGYFDCSHNQLKTLEWAPKQVEGSFDCYRNQLKTLKMLLELDCKFDDSLISDFGNFSYDQFRTLKNIRKL